MRSESCKQKIFIEDQKLKKHVLMQIMSITDSDANTHHLNVNGRDCSEAMKSSKLSNSVITKSS